MKAIAKHNNAKRTANVSTYGSNIDKELQIRSWVVDVLDRVDVPFCTRGVSEFSLYSIVLEKRVGPPIGIGVQIRTCHKFVDGIQKALFNRTNTAPPWTLLVLVWIPPGGTPWSIWIRWSHDVKSAGLKITIGRKSDIGRLQVECNSRWKDTLKFWVAC